MASVQSVQSRLAAFAATDVADALAKLGLKGFLPDVLLWSPQFAGGSTRIVGTAHTVKMVPAEQKPAKLPQHHVDAATKGCVVVIDSPKVNGAVWGGLMTTRAMHLGAVGMVTNGRIRDIEEHRSLGFPVFAAGLSCHGAGGFVAAESIGEPLDIAGIAIRAGDWIVGDANGVVVVAQDKVEEVIAECERARPIEEACMADLRAGFGIAETFLKHRGK